MATRAWGGRLRSSRPSAGYIGAWLGRAVGFEDHHVLVLQEPLRVAVGDGRADVLLLEERGVGYEPPVADAGDERGAFLVEPESGVGAGGGDHAGDVDEFAASSVGAGGDGDDAAGSQDRGGAG